MYGMDRVDRVDNPEYFCAFCDLGVLGNRWKGDWLPGPDNRCHKEQKRPKNHE